MGFPCPFPCLMCKRSTRPLLQGTQVGPYPPSILIHDQGIALKLASPCSHPPVPRLPSASGGGQPSVSILLDTFIFRIKQHVLPSGTRQTNMSRDAAPSSSPATARASTSPSPALEHSPPAASSSAATAASGLPIQSSCLPGAVPGWERTARVPATLLRSVKLVQHSWGVLRVHHEW